MKILLLLTKYDDDTNELKMEDYFVGVRNELGTNKKNDVLTSCFFKLLGVGS